MMVPGLDEAVHRAMARLLGDDWERRLRRAVARELTGRAPEKKPREITDAQREARRKSMLALIERRKQARATLEAPPAPAADPGPTPEVQAPVPPAVRAVTTRKANAETAAALDRTDPQLNAEEVHEAVEKLAKGAGARELAEWFGGGLAWWQAWCAEQRNRRAA